MKTIKILLFCVFLLAADLLHAQTTDSEAYLSTIKSEDLRQLLYVYASDYFQGRETGALGQKRAVDFLREFYKNRGIKAAKGTENYFQKMLLTIQNKEVATENVAAIIEGSEKPNEYIVIS